MVDFFADLYLRSANPKSQIVAWVQISNIFLRSSTDLRKEKYSPEAIKSLEYKNG